MPTASHLERVGDGQRDSIISETVSLNQYSLCKFRSGSWKMSLQIENRLSFSQRLLHSIPLHFAAINALGQGVLGVTKTTITVEIEMLNRNTNRRENYQKSICVSLDQLARGLLTSSWNSMFISLLTSD